MNAIQALLTDHIAIWTDADTKKKTGRGRSSGNAASVYGIRKLRELILELAVRGKLVPQDANDEPASELLKRIQAEKAKLIAEGKIKKDKPLAPITENEKTFELPHGWEWVRLGDTGRIFNGNSVSESEKVTLSKVTEGYPFVATKDIGYGLEKLDYENGIKVPFDALNFRVAKINTVFICAEGGSAGKKCGISDRDICFGNKLYANETWAGMNAKFILYIYLTPYFYNEFAVRMTGIIGGIARSEFLELPVPIPPEEEQERIVAKLDELMALCDQLETRHNNAAEAHEKLVSHLLSTLTQTSVRPEYIEGRGSTSSPRTEFEENWQRIAAHFDTLFTTEASIDSLKQTLLQLAVMGKLVPQDPNDEPVSVLLKRIQAEKARFIAEGKIKKDKPLPPIPEDEKPFELPQSWAWARIGESVLSTEYGLSEKSFEVSEGVPVLKMGDIQDGKVILGGQKKVAHNVEGLPELYLRAGDLLYNRTNSAELVGKTGIYDGLDGVYTFASYLIRIRCVDTLLSPRYLNFVMGTPLFRETQIEPHLKQQCGQANVNGTIMKNMIVSVPPFEAQKRIVAKVDELTALCDQIKTRITLANQLQQKLADVVVEQAIA